MTERKLTETATTTEWREIATILDQDADDLAERIENKLQEETTLPKSIEKRAVLRRDRLRRYSENIFAGCKEAERDVSVDLAGGVYDRAAG